MKFKKGDRVNVTAPHAMVKGSGTIAIVNGEAYGVRMDGKRKIHKWYVASELKSLSRTSNVAVIDELLLLGLASGVIGSRRGEELPEDFWRKVLLP